MSAVAQVVITGICAIATLGSDTAVLCPQGGGTNHVAVHKVFLVASDDYAVTLVPVGGQHLPVAQSRTNELGKVFTYLELSRLQIDIENQDDSPFQAAPPVTDPDQPAPIDETQLGSTSWIPLMRRVWPFWMGQHHIPPQVRDGTDPILAVKMPMSEGKLAATWVGGGTWLFQPRAVFRRKLIKAAAQEVTLEVALKLADSDLKLKLSSLPTANNNQLVPLGEVIISHRVASADPITVMLANVPDDELLPDGSIGSPCKKNARDDHFRLYYGLYGANPSHPVLPFQYDCGAPIVPSAMRVGGPNCPPIQDVDQ